MFRAMALSVIRDRGALALAFLLPPVIFLIFATVFSGTGGGDFRLQIALGAEAEIPFPARLEEALRDDQTLRVLPQVATSREALRRLIESGRADAGLYINGSLEDARSTPITVLVDPGQMLAGAIRSGQLQRVIARDLPDVAIARSAATVEQVTGGLTAEQKQRFAAALRAMEQREGADGWARGMSLQKEERAGTLSPSTHCQNAG